MEDDDRTDTMLEDDDQMDATLEDEELTVADVLMGDGAGEVWDLDPDFNSTSQTTLYIDDNDDQILSDKEDRDQGDYHEDDGDQDDYYEDDQGDHADDDDDEDDGGPPILVDEGEDGETLKAEWSEDMVQTREMEALGICVNTVAGVIVCLGCSSVVKPSDLTQHLSRVHKPIRPDPTLCDRLSETYDLHDDPLGSRPGAIIQAIFGLGVVTGFHTCDVCGYACKADWRIQRHVRESQDCETYSQRPVQTYQPSSGRMYFGVELRPAEDETDDPLDPLHYIKSKFAPPRFCDIPIMAPKSSRDANHFLNLEPWLSLVEGKTGAELNYLVRERDPELRQEVRECIDRYARAAMDELRATDNETRSAMGDYLG